MDLDDELCLCFHVSKRKVLNYLRIEQPRAWTQLADCQGAGTGCGWCRPFLRKLWEHAQQQPEQIELPSVADYATARAAHIRAGKGTPPGD